MIALVHDVVRALPRHQLVQVFTTPIIYISVTATPPDAMTTGSCRRAWHPTGADFISRPQGTPAKSIEQLLQGH